MAAAAVREQAAAAFGGFSLAGQQNATYNDVYRLVGIHEGWPHFKNGAGRHLFRYQCWWHVSGEFTPDKRSCVAWITKREIPTGGGCGSARAQSLGVVAAR